MVGVSAPIQLHENGSTVLAIEPPAPELMSKFWAAAIANGLQECLCQRCGSEWLTRKPGPLCPVCNPEHVGYEPSPSPEFYARQRRKWQGRLLELLTRRARRLQQEEYFRAVAQSYACEGRVIVPPGRSPEFYRVVDELCAPHDPER